MTCIRPAFLDFCQKQGSIDPETARAMVREREYAGTSQEELYLGVAAQTAADFFARPDAPGHRERMGELMRDHAPAVAALQEINEEAFRLLDCDNTVPTGVIDGGDGLLAIPISKGAGFTSDSLVGEPVGVILVDTTPGVDGLQYLIAAFQGER